MTNKVRSRKPIFSYRQWLLLMIFLLAGAGTKISYAHEQPITLIILDVAPEQVAMILHIPLSELESAFGHDVTQAPETMLAYWQAPFGNYLLEHLRLKARHGQQWRVQINEIRFASSAQPQSGPFQEVIVTLALIPPASANTRQSTLHYDAIMHQVVTHKALVSIRHDWELGQIAERQVGVIRVNTQTSLVEPLEINLEEGNWWDGFLGMIGLGMQHIQEGTNHLLFLLVLLLPAALLTNGKLGGNLAAAATASLNIK